MNKKSWYFFVFFIHFYVIVKSILNLCGGDGNLNTDILWSNFLSSIKDELSSLSYDTWFSETKLNKIVDDKAFVIVPMPIHKRHLQENYYDLIQDRLFDITGSTYEIEFLLEEELKVEEEKQKVISTNNVDNEFNSNYYYTVNLQKIISMYIWLMVQN